MQPSLERDLRARRPVLLALCVAFGLAASCPGPALAKTINTYKYWDGRYYISQFGCSLGYGTTYGQVITIPKRQTMLNKFVFSWINVSSGGSMVVRGEVYAWDGTGRKATGSALYESRPTTISYDDRLFHQETFRPQALPVTPGGQYVIFASIDKDYEKCTNNYELGWAGTGNQAYPDGTFVFQDNGGDESKWTNSFWTVYGGDLAFKAALSP
jgi:hypothetical protein